MKMTKSQYRPKKPDFGHNDDADDHSAALR